MAIKELFYDQRPVALLNPRASQRIDPRFKYTRTSTAYHLTDDGNFIVVPADIPRLSTEGLLLEPQSTNILPDSNTKAAMGNVVNVSPGISETTVLAPDGTNTAFRFPIGSIGFQQGNHVTTSGVVYTVSFFVKKGVLPFLYVSYVGFNGGEFVNGSVYNFDTGETLKGWKKIGDYPNGWTRLSRTYATSTSLFLIKFDSSGLNPTVYADGVYFWGFQLERQPYATSYMRTIGFTPTTRSADLLSVDSVTLPSTGSVYVDARAIDTAQNNTLISLKNASNQKINLAMEQRSELYNSLALTYSIKGTVKPTLPYPVPTTNRERNIITWGTQNYQYNTDGARFAPSLSTTPGIPANLTQLSIGHDAVDPTKAFNGYINAVYLYNGEITPTVAEALVRGELDPVNADTYSPVGPTGSLALIINTQGASSTGDKVFALPAESALNDNDIVIAWGDGTESGLDGAAAELGAAGLSHTYPSAGIYPIWVEGKLENLQFNNSASAPDLVKIEKWGTTANGNDVFLSPSTMNSAFYGCSKLTSMPSSGLPDTSAVTSWYRAFRGCSSLTGTFPSFNFSAATTFQEAFYDCSGITSFTAAGDQTQNVTNFAAAWANCSGLTSFPLINTSAAVSVAQAWQGCSSLASFPSINTASVTDFGLSWAGCSSLTSFPLLNTSSGVNFSNAWANCAGLTSFPLINTASGTTFTGSWINCTGLTSFPLINTSSATGVGYAWYNCNQLTAFPLIDTSNVSNFEYTWYQCPSLTSFPLLNTSAGTKFLATWYNLNQLTTFPSIDTSSGTNFALAWCNCVNLTSFPSLNLSAATGLASDAPSTSTGFRSTWQNCASLTDFPANRFNTTTCTRYLNAWTSCALTAQSIENILVSIEAASTSNGNLGIGGGTNAAKTTWSTAANTAYDALVARGWTITFNA